VLPFFPKPICKAPICRPSLSVDAQPSAHYAEEMKHSYCSCVKFCCVHGFTKGAYCKVRGDLQGMCFKIRNREM